MMTFLRGCSGTLILEQNYFTLSKIYLSIKLPRTPLGETKGETRGPILCCPGALFCPVLRCCPQDSVLRFTKEIAVLRFGALRALYELYLFPFPLLPSVLS